MDKGQQYYNAVFPLLTEDMRPCAFYVAGMMSEGQPIDGLAPWLAHVAREIRAGQCLCDPPRGFCVLPFDCILAVGHVGPCEAR